MVFVVYAEGRIDRKRALITSRLFTFPVKRDGTAQNIRKDQDPEGSHQRHKGTRHIRVDRRLYDRHHLVGILHDGSARRAGDPREECRPVVLEQAILGDRSAGEAGINVVVHGAIGIGHDDGHIEEAVRILGLISSAIDGAQLTALDAVSGAPALDLVDADNTRLRNIEAQGLPPETEAGLAGQVHGAVALPHGNGNAGGIHLFVQRLAEQVPHKGRAVPGRILIERCTPCSKIGHKRNDMPRPPLPLGNHRAGIVAEDRHLRV